MAGSITSSYSCDIDLHNRFMSYCFKNESSRSAIIQKLVRAYLDKEEQKEVTDILDCLTPKQLELLKLEIKKRE